MKKIAKVLLTLGVLLMIPGSVSAGPTLWTCIKPPPGMVMVLLVPVQAVAGFEAAGWICPPPGGQPPGGSLP